VVIDVIFHLTHIERRSPGHDHEFFPSHG